MLFSRLFPSLVSTQGYYFREKQKDAQMIIKEEGRFQVIRLIGALKRMNYGFTYGMFSYCMILVRNYFYLTNKEA